MKKTVLTVASAILSLTMLGQNADQVFIDAWTARHNKNNQRSGVLMDFRDSTIFYNQVAAGLEIETSATNVYDMSWDATNKALKIHMKFTGDGKADNYSGAVAVGTGIKKKKADT